MRTEGPCPVCSVATARCAATVVLPLPPFWEVITTVFIEKPLGYAPASIRFLANYSENWKAKGSPK